MTSTGTEEEMDVYDTDEFAWIEQQVAALRDGRLQDIDGPNLSEFLADMNASTKNAIGSKFAILLMHLLKITAQPSKYTRSWNLTVVREQTELTRLLQRNPGLRQHVPELYAEAYEDAIRFAVAQTGIPAECFPAPNPWTVEEALTALVDDAGMIWLPSRWSGRAGA